MYVQFFFLLFTRISVSVTGKRGAGIPIILLHDSMGGIVTVELKNGSVYRGTLDDAQDNMNCLLKVRACFLFLIRPNVYFLLCRTVFALIPMGNKPLWRWHTFEARRLVLSLCLPCFGMRLSSTASRNGESSREMQFLV